MNFEDSDEGEESLLFYSSEDEVSPTPSPVLPRRKPQPVKINLQMEESDFQAVQDRIRHIQNSFLDDADALQRASKKSDEAALQYADRVSKKVSVGPVSPSVTYVTSRGSRQNRPVVEVSMRGDDDYPYYSEERKRRVRVRQVSASPSRSKSKSKERPKSMVVHGHKETPRPKPKHPGHVSADTLSLLYANNPRSKFVKNVCGTHGRPVAKKKEGAHSDKRKEIERRLDGLLDYELPAVDRFAKMKRDLLEVNDRMATHRHLLDKYSGIDLSDSSTVSEQVEAKYQQLADRMPELEERVRASEDRLKSSSLGVTGYSKGLVPNENQQVTELRGRIRRLICRSKNNPHYYRF